MRAGCERAGLHITGGPRVHARAGAAKLLQQLRGLGLLHNAGTPEDGTAHARFCLLREGACGRGGGGQGRRRRMGTSVEAAGRPCCNPADAPSSVRDASHQSPPPNFLCLFSRPMRLKDQVPARRPPRSRACTHPDNTRAPTAAPSSGGATFCGACLCCALHELSFRDVRPLQYVLNKATCRWRSLAADRAPECPWQAEKVVPFHAQQQDGDAWRPALLGCCSCSSVCTKTTPRREHGAGARLLQWVTQAVRRPRANCGAAATARLPCGPISRTQPRVVTCRQPRVC